MTDVHTKEQRSYNMSRVRSKNTKPEILMFKMLRASGYRFRKHYAIPGKPDIAFPKLKLAVFIDGEFWHGKDFRKWKYSLTPFWLTKIEGNIKRDKNNERLLKEEGWKLLRLWGKDIMRNPDKSFLKIINFVETSSPGV